MSGFGYHDEHRPSLLAALLISMAVLALCLGCASGTVQTSYGPRPAAEVQAQDAVADVIKSLEDGYKVAVLAHDARVLTEDPLTHAKHRALLIKEHDGLVAAATTLIAWKQAAGSNYTPAAVIQPLLTSLPDYLALAVELGALSQAKADQILAYAKALFPGWVPGGGIPISMLYVHAPLGGAR